MVIHLEELFSDLDVRIRDIRQGPEGAIYLLTDSSQGKLIRVSPKKKRGTYR